MGTGARRKRGRVDRSSQAPKSDSDVTGKSSCNDSESSSNSKGFRFGDSKSVDQRHLNPSFDVSLVDYYTDEQLKEFLLTKIELLYNEAITKFVAMGHNEKIVIEALLRNGHCHGSKDLLTNIMHNTQLYLSTGASGCEDRIANSKKVFPNLMQLREASLFSLVCCLRQSNPCMTRRDAVCWLLRSDLHAVHGSSMKLSAVSNPNSVIVSTQRDDEDPVNSEPTPALIALLKDNVDFLSAECRRLEQSNEDLSSAVEKDITLSLEVLSLMNQKGIKAILEKFHDMKLEKDSDSEPEDQENDKILCLVNEIKDLEVQVKERKQWADEKAVLAARRLCNERNELKNLRKERDEDQELLKQQKSSLDIDHPTMKSLIDVEITLRQANTEADRAILIVARLEAENMDIKAEIEAFKLTTSETLSKILQAAKNEKKHMKKVVANEKQKFKLEEEIANEKQKLINVQQETIQLEAAKRSAEARWREEQASKEHAMACVKQEMRLKKETKANNKQIQESLRANIGLELKRHKDQIQRLEQELTRVKSLTDPDHGLTSLFGAPNFEDDDTIGRLLHGSGDEDDESGDEVELEHECVMCGEHEAFVVFLPCGHQVVCGGCNEESVKNGGDECPACGESIHQRIRVFCEGY